MSDEKTVRRQKGRARRVVRMPDGRLMRTGQLRAPQPGCDRAHPDEEEDEG